MFTQKVEALEKRLLASPVHKNPELETLYNLCQKKAEVTKHLCICLQILPMFSYKLYFHFL